MSAHPAAVRPLLLRRPLDEDADWALDLARDPDVVRWNPIGDVADLAAARDWCRRGADWSAGDHATWHVVDAGTGDLLANCSLHAIDLADRSARIGYRVAASARRAGVARRAVDAATAWAFAELGVVRVGLGHSAPNVASCRVAVAAGFAPEGLLRSAHVDGLGIRQDEHLHGRLVDDPRPQLPGTTVIEA